MCVCVCVCVWLGRWGCTYIYIYIYILCVRKKKLPTFETITSVVLVRGAGRHIELISFFQILSVRIRNSIQRILYSDRYIDR